MPPGPGNPHPNPPHKWGGSDLTSPTSWGRSGRGRPSPPPAGDEARGSKLPCGSLDGAESEQLASCEVDKKTWGGPAFP
ncbi:conserved hypothetical protein [Thiomonas arsenitoxydans]|nr:conserved hypothetical protein [Thiomonas arsenitoxydans]